MFLGISILQDRPHEFNYYVSGPMDWCNILYYSVGCIVIHACIQEYLLDVSWKSNVLYQFFIRLNSKVVLLQKFLKKSHLSKSKLSKFNESAQLGVFYALSLGLLGYIFSLVCSKLVIFKLKIFQIKKKVIFFVNFSLLLLNP